MIVEFSKPYLKELYETGKTSDKKHRFQPEVVNVYKKRIITLKEKATEADLFQIKSLHYERLKGDKKGLSSVRVNDKYRVEFAL